MTDQPPATAREHLSIGVIGAGTVGAALAVALTRAGYRVVAVGSRSLASAQRLAARIPGCVALPPTETTARADLLFLTVPDDVIAQVAEGLPWRPGQAAVHCSGATPLAALDAARRAGASSGTFHPLQTFAAVDQDAASAFVGVTFAIETEDAGLHQTLHRMASDLGGKGVDIPGNARALYHISGVLASNYLVTLLAEAADVWERFGYNRAQALAALLPLARGTVRNVEREGVPQALTGPIARGDVGTVAMHMAVLRERAPGVLPLYTEMGVRTVRIARQKGRLTEDAAAAVLALLGQTPSQGGSDR